MSLISQQKINRLVNLMRKEPANLTLLQTLVDVHIIYTTTAILPFLTSDRCVFVQLITHKLINAFSLIDVTSERSASCVLRHCWLVFWYHFIATIAKKEPRGGLLNKQKSIIAV